MEIIITTQQELDKLTEVKKEDKVFIRSNESLILNANISVYGFLKIETSVSMSFSKKYVEARENSSVEAWGNSSVEAWENSSVVARENSSVKLLLQYSLSVKVKLFGYSVCWKPKSEKISIEVKSKTAHIQEYEPQKYLDREGIEVIKNKVILFKRVSNDFKTQENTKNETIWAVGTTLEHHAWNPTNAECGEGKYHACSRPYFCDEFRDKKDDKYIAIEIHTNDLHEWENGSYPHKIAFRKCTVLYVCDKFGKEIKA